MKTNTGVAVLLLLASTATVQAAGYVTSGDKTAYTFEKLSHIEGSGVTFDGSYFVDEDVEIAETDTLILDPGARVCIGPQKTVTIKGVALFDPAVPSIITKIDGLEGSRGIKTQGGGEFRNVTFEYAALYSVGVLPIIVENCTFQYVTKAQNKIGAVAFAGQSKGNIIKNCLFLSNNISAIGSGGTNYCGITIENNMIYDNNTDNGNYCMMNMNVPAGNGPTVIRNNTIIGTGRPKVGGIAMTNFAGGDMSDVSIIGNTVRNCRYGMYLSGAMNVEVRDNKLYDNRYETKPATSGEGISCEDSSGKMVAILSGNHIEGSYWGVRLIGRTGDGKSGFKLVSLGEPDNKEINSPGGNVFVNNGNDGTVYDYINNPCDLYNASPFTIYAQNNTWSVPEQTPEYIENVIYHKPDNDTYGEVVYQGASSGVESVDSNLAISFDHETCVLVSSAAMRSIMVYNMEGRVVFCDNSGSNSVSLNELPSGVYVISVTTISGCENLKIAI